MALDISGAPNEYCEACNSQTSKELVLMVQARHRGTRDTIFIHASCFHKRAQQVTNQAYIENKTDKMYEFEKEPTR